MLLKVTGKILSDRNTCIVSLFYSLNSNIVLIVIVTSLILLLSPYRPSNRNKMDINCYKIIMKNLHLTLGLGKLMEETSSVFWVDLRYRLRNRDKVSLHGSER